MRILISNDDGIFAPGIRALVRAFSDAGHEVVVCAPDSQRSAASHSLSIARPNTVREEAFEGAVRAYAIGGTPADCVKLGLQVLCPEAEAVVAGVNHGYNVGTDILYSGTVGAAMEGALNGRIAMAVSQAHTRTEFDRSSNLAVRLFDTLTAHPPAPMSVLNVNYPACEEAKGVLTAVMEELVYDEVYTPSVLEDGTKVYTLNGVIEEERRQSDDYQKLEKGFATVTVLHYDMTDRCGTNVWNALI